MLEQTLRELKNYFIDVAWFGHFSITGGVLDLHGRDVLLDGQYFKIHGSVLNDGVYQWPVSGLRDEEFDGEVWALKIPKAVVEAANAKAVWVAANADVLNSPFSSESFGGYSYSKKGSAAGSAGAGVTGGTVYDDALRQWRKARYDTSVTRKAW